MGQKFEGRASSKNVAAQSIRISARFRSGTISPFESECLRNVPRNCQPEIGVADYDDSRNKRLKDIVNVGPQTGTIFTNARD